MYSVALALRGSCENESENNRFERWLVSRRSALGTAGYFQREKLIFIFVVDALKKATKLIAERHQVSVQSAPAINLILKNHFSLVIN